MKQHLITANIVIADRSYRLKIEPEDEEMVRKTIKLLNEKILEYKTQFAGKDMQDYVAMVLLWFATEQQKPAAPFWADSEIAGLKKLHSLLDKALAEENT